MSQDSSVILHTDDLLIGAPAGLASGMRKDFVLLTNGGNIQQDFVPVLSGGSSPNPFPTISKVNISASGSKKRKNSSSQNLEEPMSGKNVNISMITWKYVLQQNASPRHQTFNFEDYNPQVDFNEDGIANISQPRSFLENAWKKWNTSCIGHFMGGGGGSLSNLLRKKSQNYGVT